jgi:hypothetical protein
MSECPKQLSNTIAVACAARVPRRPVRNGDTQRRSGIWKKREFRILAQTREHTSPCVSDDKLEGTIVCRVGDNAAFRSATVLKYIVLQLAERAHQAANEPFCQPGCDRGVLGVLGPLLPGKPFRVPSAWVYPGQGKYPSAIACVGATDQSIPQRAFYVMEYGCFDYDTAVSVRERSGRQRKFNERPNPTRPSERDRSKLRQSARDRLPQEIVSRLEVRGRPPSRSLVQVASVSCQLLRIGRRMPCHLPRPVNPQSIVAASSRLPPNATVLRAYSARGYRH